MKYSSVLLLNILLQIFLNSIAFANGKIAHDSCSQILLNFNSSSELNKQANNNSDINSNDNDLSAIIKSFESENITDVNTVPVVQWKTFMQAFDLNDKELKLSQLLSENDFSLKNVGMKMFGSPHAVSPSLKNLLFKTSSKNTHDLQILIAEKYTIYEPLKIESEEDLEDSVVQHESSLTNTKPIDHYPTFIDANPLIEWDFFAAQFGLTENELKLCKLLDANNYSPKIVGSLLFRTRNAVRHRLTPILLKTNSKSMTEMRILLYYKYLKNNSDKTDAFMNEDIIKKNESPDFQWDIFAKQYSLSDYEIKICKLLTIHDFSPLLVAPIVFRTKEAISMNLNKIIKKTKTKSRIDLQTLLYKNYLKLDTVHSSTNKNKLDASFTHSSQEIINWNAFANTYKILDSDVQLVQFLTNGNSLSEYSDLTGRSINSIRIQLSKNIFKKVNIEKQEELIQLLYTEFRKSND